VQATQASDQPTPIHSPDLIKHDKAIFFSKAARNSEGIGMAAGRHGSDHEGAQMVVQFIRRDDSTRSHFLDFLALGRTQSNQVNVPAAGRAHSQTHSDSSNADR